MQQIKEFTCPGGAVLKVRLAPFADAKALYQAMLSELGNVSIKSDREIADLYKDLFCIGMSSPQIEACLWKCLEICQYNSLKIDKDTFEPEIARGDYMFICMEVAKANVSPFVKDLYAQFQTFLAKIQKSQA